MIRRMCSGLVLATAIGVAGMAWAKAPQEAPPAAPKAAQPGEQPGGQAPAQAYGGEEARECSPAQVAGILLTINKCAIDTGKLALQKSQNDDVRTYAQKQIETHTNLDKKLRAAIEDAGITPAESDISRHLKTESQELLDKLGSSAQFDRDFATHEVVAHATVSGLFHAIAAKRADAGEEEESEGAEESAGSEASEHAGYTHGSEHADALTKVFTKAREKFEKHEQKALELQSKVAGACGAPAESPETPHKAPAQTR